MVLDAFSLYTIYMYIFTGAFLQTVFVIYNRLQCCVWFNSVNVTTPLFRRVQYVNIGRILISNSFKTT